MLHAEPPSPLMPAWSHARPIISQQKSPMEGRAGIRGLRSSTEQPGEAAHLINPVLIAQVMLDLFTLNYAFQPGKIRRACRGVGDNIVFVAMDAIGIFLVLVGPPGVGKTPISELLAKELKVEHLMLDLMEYRRECIGWNQERELEIWRKFGTEARYDYRSRFAVPMLRSLVEEFPAAVIDCGGDEFLTRDP